MHPAAVADTPAGIVPRARLSPLQRGFAIFARPAEAWTGLAEHGQWWFPMLIVVAVAVACALALHQRALVPMVTEAWEQQVANGQMQQDQLDQMERFISSPVGAAFTVGQQVLVLPIMTLVIALVVWFGVGFVLGTTFRYRLALEVAAWSSLITLPSYLLTAALAWVKQTMRGVHVGFGILLPDMDPPSKLHVALGVLLDALGPLSIWYLVVGILGAAALSGAPRKSVAWVMGGVYLALVALMAALAALFTPAA